MKKIENALERIANALERIADSMERSAALSQKDLADVAELVDVSEKAVKSEPINLVEEKTAEVCAEGQKGVSSQEAQNLTTEKDAEPEISPEANNEELTFDLPGSEQRKDFACRFPNLVKFLESKNIYVCDVFSPLLPKSLDDRLEEIALYMGNHYADISSLLMAIKANLRTGFNFSLDFASCSSASAKAIDKLCRALYEIAFLDEYRYLGYPDFKLQTRAATIGIAHNFFSGFWFERYIAQQAAAVIKKIRREYGLEEDDFEIVRNAKLMCQGVPRERDILVSCSGEYYWLECKSGDNYVDSISAYDTFSAHFGFEADNCFLVFLSHDFGCHRAAGSGIRICSSAEFADRFSDTLRHNLEKAGYTKNRN
ncbi:MAG: hypothetical protein ACI38Q_01500 [Candidatus Bruticola sp.]